MGHSFCLALSLLPYTSLSDSVLDPFYGTSATFANLQSTQNGLIAKYGKNVMNVETNWPVVCSGTALSQPAIPISVAGQQTWITDLKNTLTALSGSHGIGISYW